MDKIKQRPGVNYGKIDWQTELPKLKKLVEEDKMPFEEISKIYNRPAEQIKVICTKYGVDYIRTNSKPWSKEEIDIVRESLLKGISYKDIAEKVGRTRNAVRALYEYHREEHNLVKPFEDIPQITISEDKMIEVRDLVLRGYNYGEITNITGIRTPGILKVKKKYNIKSPSRSELMDLGIFYIRSEKDSPLIRIETELTSSKFLSLLDSGVTVSELSRKYSLDVGVLNKYAHRIGWKDKKLENAKQLKYKILKDTLGREPTKEELKQPFCDIFTEDYLMDLLRKTDYNFSACGEELEIDPKGLHQAVDKLGIKIPDEIFKKSRSYGEKVISKVLSELGIKYKTQFRLDNAIPNRIRTFIDFCLVINGITYWVEANGRQHYDSNNSFTRSFEDFVDQVKRDMYLKELAKNKGVVFIEIPYTYYSTKKIQDLLQRVIIEGEDINNIIDYTPFYKEIEELGISIDEN